MTSQINTNIVYPQSPFLDPLTGRPSREWMLWLMNPSYVGVNVANVVPVVYGGTGTSSPPTNGQLLIGNAGGYALRTLTAGSGISITNGPGVITIDTSVTGVAAGTYGDASHAVTYSVNANGQLTSSSNTPIAISASQVTSGTFTVPMGGTGAATLTGYVKGNGTSTMTASPTVPYTDISGGATGSFKTGDTPQKTVTVVNGIITSIV